MYSLLKVDEKDRERTLLQLCIEKHGILEYMFTDQQKIVT